MFAAGWDAHLDLFARRLQGAERGDFIAQYKAKLKHYPAPAKLNA